MTETKLSEYALIGNSRSAALVSSKGSIDWCCIPEFDSSSVFASILDSRKGGFFSIAPVSPFYSVQSYLPDTNVAETYFTTEEGEVRLWDAFTVMDEEEKKHALFPDHEILRVIEGISGTVRIKFEYLPRTFYGKNTPHLKDSKKLGINFSWKGHYFNLLTTLQPSLISMSDERGKAQAEFEVKKGERVIFSFSYSNQGPAILPELELTSHNRMLNTINFWRRWVGKCQYDGLYKEQVRRSALALKLLAHAPSGAIIAAPTTSLPEQVGGERNWDYRYCWLRDASFTIRALLVLGFKEEAVAYMNWILHATRLTRPKLQVVYSLFGHAKLKEKSLEWLEGYKSSKPIRIGNNADSQFQLDVYGEVLDAVYAYSPFVEAFDNTSRKFILGLGEVICELWDKPDNGIWEIRSELAHHTHSKVMAWVGLDRLTKLAAKYNWKDAKVEKYQEVASAIRVEVEQFGYNEELKSYTRELKGDVLDASLLTLSLVNFCDPDAPRMMSTCELIYKKLSKNNLIYRYLNVNDGLLNGEGCFGICNFWLAENFAKSGKLKEAMDVFEATLKCAGPSGLFSEEMDPDTLELIGNFPQGFTHIGLINAALSINEAHMKPS